ncbi:MAG TPA: hypothetical protein VHK88_17315 [Aquihabitans sp.]|nr:hypothetical protein [Aquihabitans sp.]
MPDRVPVLDRVLVLIWFAACSVVLVTIVFSSPAIDHRTVILGSVLPVAEAALGGPRVLHSLAGGVAVLVAVVLATSSRRVLRRRLLGVPIGLLCHLVLDGSFTRTDSFWWPFAGGFASGQIPEVDHLAVSLLLELAGVAVAWWAWGRFGLREPAARRRFLHDGRLTWAA